VCSSDLEGVRRARVEHAVSVANEVVWDTRFGSGRFLDLLKNPIDALCHHGADVTDYKSDSFDVAGALASNTHNALPVIERFAESGGRQLVLTASVFGGGEGAGSDGLPHFSPYGLSKSLTTEVFRYYAEQAGLRFGKFVISNPFGPFEEPRFTSYLMKSWHDGKTPSVRTPAYIRDNIHIDLLAKCYAEFVGGLPSSAGESKLGPSGYIESQGTFAERLASEMRTRLSLPCGLELLEQTEFPEPRIRINTDAADPAGLGWSEERAWDAFAEFYAAQLASGRQG